MCQHAILKRPPDSTPIPSDPLKTHLRSLVLFTAAFLVCDPSHAQEIDLQRLDPPEHRKHDVAASASDLEIIHVTDILSRTTEAREGLLKYIQAREAGLLPVRKGGPSFDVGQEKAFNVLQNIQEEEDAFWTTETFILRSTNNVANVWIEKSMDATVSDEQLEELDEHVLFSTPEHSFRPDKGIIENNNYLFGAPPNVDGDGKVDILLFDIEEGTGGTGNVLGFVTSADLNPEPQDNRGNAADILYVDIKEGLTNSGVQGLAWIISHEYQHLIHYAYQDTQEWWILTPELTFVNEGFSEWASVVNGYFNRGITYLEEVVEHGTTLLDWDTASDLYDYERAGLFTTYIADRIGPEATGSIVRAMKQGEFGESFAVGAEGYDVVLQDEGLSLSEIIPDFHVANFVNDVDADSRYGYVLQQRKNILAVPTTPVNGSSSTSMNLIDVEMPGGAVRYITWTDVADITLRADSHSEVAPQLIDFYRTRMALHVIAERVNGTRTIEAIEPGEDSRHFEGEFSRLTLAVVNSNGSPGSLIRLDISANWIESGGSGAIIAEAYDDGIAAGDSFYFAMPELARYANKFNVPAGSRLTSVHVAPVYDNDFLQSDAPAGAPRDFRLHVWGEDGEGYPGDELFSMDVTEDPLTQHINFETRTYSFLEIELPDISALSEPGDSVFVGLSNIGTDVNFLALVPSFKQEGEDVAYLYFDYPTGTGWASLTEVTETGSDVKIFADKVHPIRVEYLVATSTDPEDEAELPARLSLAQNYPNPFNPSTSISYSLPEPMQVRLSVFDALGRLVTTLVDGVQAGGHHEARLTADGWASGVYYYILETDAHSMSKPMVLMK